ncbi:MULTISPECIES: sensor histidine kinase [Bacillaceae]|uniref:Sensor histidine kinase n=1 Tax=Evansella alkalicola TaxID=745819 RepID=A0ABS6JUJ3_9BACI|nr:MULTISPECIES: sensor histidine kinase [Bacillaceae]MBU9721927.1 sensor histidine kinase [Bacillus alkalicola]
MNLIKQIVVGLIGAILFTSILLIPTFLMFPLDDWSLLMETSFFDVSYLHWVVIVTVVVGIVTGFSYGAYFRSKLKVVHDRLEETVNDQKVSFDELDKMSDMKSIKHQFKLLEDKLLKQAEVSQKLVTERATEREKSLQEVVLQERNRLARELHDSVSQQLFAASMMMSAVNEDSDNVEDGMKAQLQLVERMIEQSQLEMRALLLHLRPIALKEKTLHEGAVELLTELRQKVPMNINWKIEPMELDKGIEDHLFRILQESVSNALRHSKAEKLDVMLVNRDNTVIMRVSDDGVGFNVEEAETNGSYGMVNMQERAIEIGGTLKVVSVVNQGTRLEVKVPQRKIGGDVLD